MPKYTARIDIVEGDAIAIRRTINRTRSGMVSGTVLTKAWLTVKNNHDQADPGLVQKAITTTDVPGTGQIEDDGTDDANPIVRFDLVNADTVQLIDAADKTAGVPSEKVFDIQVLTDAGGPYTGERGSIWTHPEVTAATS